MQTLQQEIQAQIDELKTSKFGKLSDAQLQRKEKLSVPFSLIQQLHQEYIEKNISLPQLGKMYNMSGAVIQKLFSRYKLKVRANGVDANILQQRMDDVQNGMSLTDFMTKYNCSRDTYFRMKRKCG